MTIIGNKKSKGVNEMKQVKSKITGCIGELDFDSKEGVFIVVCYDLNTKETVKSYYKSLEDLCEEWEDYEEPVKPYWFINDLDGEPMKCDLKNCGKSNFIEWGEHRKQIGNYFETEEEAEKAVEKLKAWKRLKDKGIEFYGWRKNQTGTYDFLARWKDVPPRMNEIINDLDLLFGGEE